MPFAFEKLHVYQKALTFADSVCSLTRSLPRGYYSLVNQLNCASLSLPTTQSASSMGGISALVLWLNRREGRSPDRRISSTDAAGSLRSGPSIQSVPQRVVEIAIRVVVAQVVGFVVDDAGCACC